MKRFLKSWVFWAFVVVSPLTASTYYGHQVEEWDACPACLSERKRSWLGFGTESRLFYALHLSTVEVPSRLRADILDDGHEHRWTFWRFYATSLRGETFGGGGPGSPRWCAEVAHAYEESGEFRRHVGAKPSKEVNDVLRHAIAGRADGELGRMGDAWLKEFFGSMPP